ncbi:hypothetical protein ATCC90586_008629 [Pythium insidiosum]|nr:hypothetical protein ATCC90586_008629 [Pythium insidiosum]
MRQRALFDRLSVYVCPDALGSHSFDALECCLRDGGAALLPDPKALTLTHIVCHPSEYDRFVALRNERFFAIVRPEWVFRSFLIQKLLPVDTFSANPARFFSSLAIAAGAIDKDPRKVIDGLIAHFGGQIVHDTSDTCGATHVLSVDGAQVDETAPSEAHRTLFQMAHTDADTTRHLGAWRQWLEDRPTSLDFALPACLVAFLGKQAGLSERQHVNYSWIEECVKRKQRVLEQPFAHKQPKAGAKTKATVKSKTAIIQIEDLDLSLHANLYLNSRSSGAVFGEVALARKISPDQLSLMQDALAGAIILVAQHIPPSTKEVLSDVLKAAKAKVANVPLGDSYKEIVQKVVANASFVVCQYQSGCEYEEAIRQKKKTVSVYWVLSGLGSCRSH